MAEDDDYSQDSEAYRKWRSGEDNDRYASSKTPSETGARSGSYTTPKSENDEYTPPDEDDNSEKIAWYVWAFLIITTIPFLIVASSEKSSLSSSNEDKEDIAVLNTSIG